MTKRGGSSSRGGAGHHHHHHHPSSSSSSSVLLPPPPPPPPAPAVTTAPPHHQQQRVLYKIDWTNDVEWKFFRALFSESGGHCFRPVGLNKHFNMLLVYHRFRRSLGRNVDIECLWAKLDSLYDMDYLDEAEEDNNRKGGGGHYNLPACLFPPPTTAGGAQPFADFNLPNELFTPAAPTTSKTINIKAEVPSSSSTISSSSSGGSGTTRGEKSLRKLTKVNQNKKRRLI